MGIDVSKVSEEGFEFDETALSEFCGRRKDVDDIVRLITKKGIKTLCVHGAKSIGKTRVINHVLMNEKLNCFQQICHIDCSSFEEDCVDNFFIQFLKEFYESVGLEKNLKPCGACELCAHKTGCTKLNRETLLKEIPLTLKHVQEATLICFDNADKLLNSSFRGKFLDFLQTVTEKRKNINIKILVASTVRFHMTTKATELRLVDKMAKEDLKTMMVGILNHNNDDIDDIDESDEVGKSGIKYLSALRTQDPWLEAVAILCDGIPKCAELLGTILRDDGYFIEPIELVQLLLTNFIQMLNPDLFPKDDRPTAKYHEELVAFNAVSEAYEERWLYKIAESMKGTEITSGEGLQAVRDDGSQVAKGTFKMFGLRKMMDYSILQKREKNNEALSMQRLYKHLLVNVFNGMNAFKTINLENMKDDDGLSNKTYNMEQSLTLIREDAKRVGLDLDHAENLDAVKVEQVLYRRDQRMKREDSGRSSGDENEDDSGNDSNDTNEDSEHRMNKFVSYDEQYNDHVLNSGYNSISGPLAMSFKTNVNGIVDKEAAQEDNQVAFSNGLARDDQNDNHGDINSQRVDLDPENDFLRRSTNDYEARHEHKGEKLSNTFPSAKLRKGLQPEENSDDTKLKRERTSSTNQIYVSPVHRLSSEEYGQNIENHYINTSEARDERQDRESPTNGDKDTCTRYSGSSTDSGEIKLDFETKTFAGEK